MGLGGKLEKKNVDIQQQMSTAHAPVCVGGYNNYNIPTLPPPPPLSQQETYNAHQISQQANYDAGQKLAQMRNVNLVKPVPKPTGNPSKDLINTMVCNKMWRIVCLKEIHNFFTQDQLQNLVDRACMHDYQVLQNQMEIPTLDMATDISVLGLYNIILYLDDSGSMGTKESNENMTRWDLLKEVTKTISFWGSLMDIDGICVRFFNSNLEGNCITSPNDVATLLQQASPNGTTPMGANLRSKVFDRMILPIMNQQDLDRPVLIATVTDGIPDKKEDVIETIKYCRNTCLKTKYGQNAVAFSFSQVGTDKNASAWLGEIDTHPEVGHVIDCTSEYNMEKQECGPNFTESVWLIKLLIGAIDPSYDQADEQPRVPQQSYHHFLNNYGQPPTQYGYNQQYLQGQYQQAQKSQAVTGVPLGYN
jgi:hypothetical protein